MLRCVLPTHFITETPHGHAEVNLNMLGALTIIAKSTPTGWVTAEGQDSGSGELNSQFRILSLFVFVILDYLFEVRFARTESFILL